MVSSKSIIAFLPFICLTLSSALQSFEWLSLPSRVYGSESLAFDLSGVGPYTGVSNGRILKFQGQGKGWMDFAVTSAMREKSCDGSLSTSMESVCGRPLGLQFSKATTELYIADAYNGLVAIGQSGGVAWQLASEAEGEPFCFLNGLDIDQETGVVYFTDSSTRYQRKDILKLASLATQTAIWKEISMREEAQVEWLSTSMKVWCPGTHKNKKRWHYHLVRASFWQPQLRPARPYG